ncbi:hypothetical protein PIB30_000348 [Stylosanthes scabra]|uniref:Uncharacterized protein n=1 Tax=Stylosanthes scabra TaxID=79078 RepID=A0ABU6U246_9FABA|nr:hypothetical protein [Stylosanthes scabra]
MRYATMEEAAAAWNDFFNPGAGGTAAGVETRDPAFIEEEPAEFPDEASGTASGGPVSALTSMTPMEVGFEEGSEGLSMRRVMEALEALERRVSQLEVDKWELMMQMVQAMQQMAGMSIKGKKKAAQHDMWPKSGYAGCHLVIKVGTVFGPTGMDDPCMLKKANMGSAMCGPLENPCRCGVTTKEEGALIFYPLKCCVFLHSFDEQGMRNGRIFWDLRCRRAGAEAITVPEAHSLWRKPNFSHAIATPLNKDIDDAAAETCVVAVLVHLTRTMAAHTEAMKEATNIRMTQEMRHCSRIVDECLDAFVRPKKRKCSLVLSGGKSGEKTSDKPSIEPLDGETKSSQPIQVVDLSWGPISESTASASAQGEATPTFPPGLISEWLDDTLLLGAMIPAAGDSVGEGFGVDGGTVPSSVRGKLQVRLGHDDDELGSDSGDRTRSARKGKMVAQTPKQDKRSGKLRRTIRETMIDLYGYKKSGVVFPSFKKCKFKIQEKYKYS